MATTSEALTRITAATGLPAATVEQTAKYLRADSRGYWPKGGKGGGKSAAHITADHAINLILALMGADPLTDAPNAVERLRGLVPTARREYTTINGVMVAAPTEWQNDTARTLAHCLGNIVESCKTPVGRSEVIRLVEGFTVWHNDALASISINDTTTGKAEMWSFMMPSPGLLSLMDAPATAKPSSPVTNTATIPATIFAEIAEMLTEREPVLGLEQSPEKRSGPKVPASEPSSNEGGSDQLSRAARTGVSALTSRKPAIVESAKQAERENGSPRVRPSTRRTKGSDNAANHPPIPHVA